MSDAPERVSLVPVAFGWALSLPEERDGSDVKYIRADISEAAKAAARAEGERIGMERATMPDREMIAFVLWKAEADRAAPNVGRTRTLAGFSEESEYTRTKWLSLADAIRAAMDATP